MTPNLDKYFFWWKGLRAGDPFTLIDDRRQMEDGFDGRGPQVGEKFTKWFATNEAPRVFEIVVVHPEHDGKRVYECRYVGFAPTINRPPKPGELLPADPRPQLPKLSGGEYAAVPRAVEELLGA